MIARLVGFRFSLLDLEDSEVDTKDCRRTDEIFDGLPMAIIVVCPSCQACFQASEKYAGQQGRCPKCKGLITVPPAAEEVIIHEPELLSGAKNGKNVADFEPLARMETKVRPAMVIGVIVAVALAFAVAAVLRGSDWKLSSVLLSFGAVILAPPLALAGYTFLRNQELEPYRGKELGARVAVCAAMYGILWGMLWGLKHWLLPGDATLESWSTLFLLVPPLAVGSITAWATLDLDLGSGFFHYCLYLGVCVLLRLTMGLPAL